MNKNIVIVIIVLIIATIGGLLILSHKRTSPLLATAKKYEMAGDLQAALSAYCEAACNLSPSLQVPDINRLKFLSFEEIKKEVVKYTTWLWTPPASKSMETSIALSGIERCIQFGRKDITYTEPKPVAFTEETYRNAWNGSFFSQEAKVDPSHAALAFGNFSRNLSLIVATCNESYSYELCLLDNATLQSTKCMLLSENSVRMYATPGEHLLLVRSTVTFPSGEVWKSHFMPIPLSIPEKASEIAMKFRTSVKRK
jgi:hypothetical protein